MLSRAVRRGVCAAMAVVALVACVTSTAGAQTLNDTNRGNITFTGAFDFLNAYMFRGLRQDDTRLIMWPSIDAGIRLQSGTGAVKNTVLHVGSWNSLHTGITGSAGPTHRLWYESDFYTTLALALGDGLGLGATYTAYTSPNSSFSTVKELAFKVTADDSTAPAGGVSPPYGLVALEI